MKIKTKLLLGLSSKPILILLIIVIGWFEVSSIHKLNETTQNNYQLSLLAENIHREVKDEAISMRNLVIFQDQDSIQRELSQLEMESNSIAQNIASLESMVYSENQKEIIRQLIAVNQKFNIYKDEIIKLTSDGRKQEAIDLINDNGHSIHEEFFQVLSVLSQNLENNVISSFGSASDSLQKQIIISSLIALISIILSAGFIVRTVWNFAARLGKVAGLMNKIATGEMNLNSRVEILSDDEIDQVAKSFNRMAQSLEEQVQKEKGLLWNKTNIADITTSLNGKHNIESLSSILLSKVVPLLGACSAVLYVREGSKHEHKPLFKKQSSYAGKEQKAGPETFIAGEGLMGQAVLEKEPILLTEVPADYIKVKSGLGESPPLIIYVLPIIFEDEVIAVLEMASFKEFTPTQHKFLEELNSSVGIIIDSVMGRIHLAQVLEETQVLMEEIQVQSEELQSQQEELRVTNEELEEQTQVLRQSEEKLQVQQEDLEQVNIELKERTEKLEEQNKRYEITYQEVEKSRAELEEKAKQLALSSKYKSEFLANMSHELRTPLNSLLILSKLLADNHEGNLSDKQVQYSKTIFSSGNDLLTLINEILDLAKVESGKMKISPSEIQIQDLLELIEMRFRPVANEKGLTFAITLGENAPTSIFSDEQRLLQVLENLLSNAFKFTEKGEVSLVVSGIQDKTAFTVRDTGIGIPKDKQELIFEAFQQADGTTSRKYGGTGLGLSICKETSILLGGNIVVDSVEGHGSVFTFSLGDYHHVSMEQEVAASLKEVSATIENDNATIEEKPKEGILSEQTKKISSQPPNSIIKKLLIVDDDLKQRTSLMELIGDMDVIIKAVATGEEALEELKVQSFDLMVMDLGLKDTTGFDLLNKINEIDAAANLKIIIYTGRDLSSKEEIYLNQFAHTIIIKDGLAPQRLIEEVKLFLDDNSIIDEKDHLDHREAKKLNDLKGRRILLVDDDVRNVYALSSFLELYGLDITFAENGVECLQLLECNNRFDLVLMDIMMPEMDGYEAIQRIRAIPQFNTLPIIALTAKAMKEDRVKCIEAGASDYIVKPFEPKQLISLIQVWLYSQEGIKK